MRIVTISILTSMIAAFIGYGISSANPFWTYSIASLLLPGLVMSVTLGLFGKKPTFLQWVGFIVTGSLTYLIPAFLPKVATFSARIVYAASWIAVALSVLLLFHWLLAKFQVLRYALCLGFIVGLVASLPAIVSDFYFANRFYLDNDPVVTKFVLRNSTYPLLHIGLSIVIYLADRRAAPVRMPLFKNH